MSVTTVAPPTGADTNLRGVARGGLANLAGTGFTGLAGLVVTWLVARALGGHAEPTGAHAGAFFAATAAFVLANAVAKLGTQTSLVYWPARLRARGAGHLVGRCLRVALVPVAGAALVLAAAIWLAAPHLAGGDARFVAPQLRVLALFLPAAALSDALLAATRGYRSMRPTVLVDRLLRPALQVAGLGVLAGLHASAASFALGWAAPYLVSALLAARALGRLYRPAPAGPAAPVAGPFWRFGAPRAAAGIAQLALQRVDVLLVAALAGLPAAAVYAVAGSSTRPCPRRCSPASPNAWPSATARVRRRCTGVPPPGWSC